MQMMMAMIVAVSVANTCHLLSPLYEPQRGPSRVMQGTYLETLTAIPVMKATSSVNLSESFHFSGLSFFNL